jgi:5-methylcytosine-specific restriction enzyme subunit McrC
MLLYAKTEEEEVPNLDTHIGGNRFLVRALDLNTDFEGIRMQLNDIVECVFADER